MKKVTEQQMLQRAAALCSSGEHCRAEMKEKILNAGLDEEAAERIIAQLEKEKFIDASRYAQSFVNDRFRFNKWGKMKLRAALRQKEIADRDIDEALGNLNEEEYRQTLKSLLLAKLKSTPTDDGQRLMASLLRFAASRGFESGITLNCLHELLNPTDHEKKDLHFDDLEE